MQPSRSRARLAAALWLCLLLCAAPPASAQPVRFAYIGNTFSQATPGLGLSRVALWFDVNLASLPGNAHVVLDSYSAGGLLSFAFSDGHNTISNDPYDGLSVYSDARISFDTDAAGHIAGNWDARAFRAHGNQDGLILSDSISTVSLRGDGPNGVALVLDSASSLGSYTASVSEHPGTWSTMPGVPEPHPAYLLGLGLVLLHATSRARHHCNPLKSA